MKVRSGGLKAGGTARGSGGICPAKSHSKYFDVNLAEAQDLARVAIGKVRKLDKIPDNSRLEATGLRVESSFMKPTSNGEKPKQPVQVRASVGTVVTGYTKPVHLPAELEKRTKAEWNGLHVNIKNGQQLWVKLQHRVDDHSPWKHLLEVIIDPLPAFKVEDQDVVWHPTQVNLGENGSSSVETVTVWVEFSLMRLTSKIMEFIKSRGIAVKRKSIVKKKFEYHPKKRTPEEVEEEEAWLQELIDEKDAMTFQDKVHMKDIWNKCLGWIDLTGEFIVDGLFLRCPDLLEILGKTAAELTFDMMVGLIDMAVRGLDERTEVTARESYNQIPLSRPEDRPFTTFQEGVEQFAQLGMRPRHWREARAMFVLAMQKANPYLEESDVEVLQTGSDSCTYKFWNQRIMLPALQAIKDLDVIFESEENRSTLQYTMKPFQGDKKAAGMLFYKNLMTQKPAVIPFFGTTDMNFLAGHLFDAIELLVETFNDFATALHALKHLGKVHDNARIPTWTYPAITELLHFTLLQTENYGNGTPEGEKAVKLWNCLITRANLVTSRISFVSERLIRKAFEWSEQVAHELKWDESYLAKRKYDIESEIRTKGTYSHTEEELVHGARVGWRNSAKCVGRIAWNTMFVRDRRHVKSLDQIFAECVEHQRLATADGSLKAVMTIFPARQPGTRLGYRFWGLQLIRFACYEMPDGSFMGDKANIQYTKECIDFGWKPPEPRTEFDVLPVVIEDTIAGITKMFEVPKEIQKITMIKHPQYPEFGKLGLRWCVVPTVTCFTLILGGIQYTCCPFNGWFMETEITRDLLEPGRMDKMEAIAHAIGVDPTDEDSFWRERVFMETNRAIVYSFRKDGNSIVDHVTAQAQFLAHDLREKREGRECPAQWSWVVPAFGGSTMPIWHHEMRDFYIEPQYLYQAEVTALRAHCNIPEKDICFSEEVAEVFFEKLLILYGSVTGTTEGYAYKAKKKLRPLRVDVKGCDQIDVKTLWKDFTSNGGPYSALLVITSTFGEGDPPSNAVNFLNVLKTLPNSALSGIDYSVMAIGSRVYPDFCKAGIDMDYWFRETGANQILPLGKADELQKQNETVEKWIASIAAYFNLEQKRALILSGDLSAPEVEDEDGAPVVIQILQDDDAAVKKALEQEKELDKVANVGDRSVGSLGRFLPDDYVLCRVTRNSELVDFSQPGSKDAYKSTRFLEFDLLGTSKNGSSKNLTYVTGDHAKILPCNSPETIKAMCSCLNLDADTWVQAKVQEGMGRPLTSAVARVGDILSMELDLATQDKDGNLPLLEKLLGFGRSIEMLESDKLDEKKRSILTQELLHLELTVENLSEGATAGTEGNDFVLDNRKEKQISYIIENYLDIPSLLKDFPLVASKLTLADCIEVLPRLKPRYYSIASSSELHPSSLQLTVGVLTVPYKSTKKVREGICSNYLAQRQPLSDFVRLGVHTSSFRLPVDMTTPMIMVGPGTGVSPMMGFLQAREKALADGISLGPCMVLFGCRTEDDFLHRDQMRCWEKSGVITNLQLALSRVPGQPKEYVQHRISKIRPKVWDLLKHDKCHYYVCGDTNMAEDVYDELFYTVKTAGNMRDHKATWSFFQKMKEEHRYQADTWGVVMKRKEGLAKQAEKKYNQAEAWLKSVTTNTEEDKDDCNTVHTEENTPSDDNNHNGDKVYYFEV